MAYFAGSLYLSMGGEIWNAYGLSVPTILAALTLYYSITKNQQKRKSRSSNETEIDNYY